ncbi:MAG TPA: hypothetical protein ENN13_02135 [Candidatus Altiarchaeales archaeon]|nr:hypothetical protein [Candidatus Altiarchaeales archaeon]
MASTTRIMAFLMVLTIISLTASAATSSTDLTRLVTVTTLKGDTTTTLKSATTTTLRSATTTTPTTTLKPTTTVPTTTLTPITIQQSAGTMYYRPAGCLKSYTICGDGTCVRDPADCPCPDNLIKCPNGRCVKDRKECATTTTTTLYASCDDISSPSERTCMKGACPPNTVCRLVPASSQNTGYLAANMQQGSECKCVPCDCDETTTTTTLPLRCERLDGASEKVCAQGLCPDNRRCLFSPGSGNTLTYYAPPTCYCETTTTTTLPTKCEAIEDDLASQRTCKMGLCPPDSYCVYKPGQIQSGYLAAVVTSPGSCECVTTTTTLPGQVRCEALDDASLPTCEQGLCPPDYKCRYIQGVTAANVGYCQCVSVTTTTIPGPVKCEAVQFASENTCTPAVCPEGQTCELYTVNFGSTQQKYCVCMGGSTTTTTIPTCELIESPSSRMCAEGLCPDDRRCVYSPGSSNVATHYVPPKCYCETTTTTTLPTRCEEIDSASASQRACRMGLCPDNTYCVYTPGQAQSNYLAAVVTSPGSCECVTTTTTLPNQVRCEAIDGANANTCSPGICPPETYCRYVPSAVAANMGSCMCIPTTTTTLPGEVRCEAVDDANQRTCQQALCPPDYECRLIQGATAANVQYCQCLPVTTTTLPGPVMCEDVQYPSSDTCSAAECPDGQQCRVYTVNFGSTQQKYCVCMGDSTTTTTIPGEPIACKDVTNPGENTCAPAVCPEGMTCQYYRAVFGSGVQENCICMESSAPAQNQQGFVARLWQSIFG